MEEKELYEEFSSAHWLVGWILLIILCVLIVGYAMWFHLIIPDSPRAWDYGAAPSAPSESVYTSVAPPYSTEGHLQIQPIPGAEPLEEPSPPPVHGLDESNGEAEQ